MIADTDHHDTEAIQLRWLTSRFGISAARAAVLVGIVFAPRRAEA